MCGEQGWSSGESTRLPPTWPGFNSRSRRHTVCGLSLLLILSPAPRGFSPGTPIFLSPQNPTLPNSNSIWNARTRWTPMCYNSGLIFFLFSVIAENKPHAICLSQDSFAYNESRHDSYPQLSRSPLYRNAWDHGRHCLLHKFSNICKPEEGWYGQAKYCYKKTIHVVMNQFCSSLWASHFGQTDEKKRLHFSSLALLKQARLIMIVASLACAFTWLLWHHTDLELNTRPSRPHTIHTMHISRCNTGMWTNREKISLYS